MRTNTTAQSEADATFKSLKDQLEAKRSRVQKSVKKSPSPQNPAPSRPNANGAVNGVSNGASNGVGNGASNGVGNGASNGVGNVASNGASSTSVTEDVVTVKVSEDRRRAKSAPSGEVSDQP
ncbi:hypothetical protein V8C86DRAFT_3152571 [Haematococcus lacustris]